LLVRDGDDDQRVRHAGDHGAVREALEEELAHFEIEVTWKAGDELTALRQPARPRELRAIAGAELSGERQILLALVPERCLEQLASCLAQDAVREHQTSSSSSRESSAST
jgi:hypothetical protein